MQMTRCHTVPRRLAVLARFFAVAAILAAVGCGGSDSSTAPPTGPTGTFKGTLVGESASGVLTVSFPGSATARAASPTPSRFSLVRVAEAASGPVDVTGTLTLTGGGVVQLTGVYNPDNNPSLVLAGEGYGLTGNYTPANGVFSGTSTFPDGKTGLWTVSADAATVNVFCGTYSSTEGKGGGTWNLVLDKNNNVTGVATGGGALQGTLSNGALSVTYTGGTASGTLDVNTGGGSGSYSAPGIGEGDAGTWSANTGGC